MNLGCLVFINLDSELKNMSLLSIDELKTLAENSQTPSISLYMPMQKAGPEIRQNPIRFKNLIREAEERLDAMKIDHTQGQNLLQLAMELDTSEFWEHQDRGLAIFISPQVFRYYQLPMEFPELVVVSDRFHLKPLLHLLNNDGSFYVLALSQKDVRFFEGTRYSLNQIEVENMPKSLDETLLEDEIQKGVQQRIGTSKRGAANASSHPGTFHGQGSPDRDKHQEDILQFCYAVDTALHEKLREQKAPLVLAGVEYLFPIYQEANTYNHLVEEPITGNPQFTKPEELKDQAWQIVEPLFDENQKQIMELYQQIAGEGTGKASNNLQEIIAAAYYQRVDNLFVPVGQQIWGKFDPETMAVDSHPEPEPEDYDLLDFAAIHTLLNGGQVFAVEPEKMPNDAPAAAIFRF
ncbi:Bacterial archaeo-eukaryotic release factor family 6 domain-containing protein [Nostoc sp. DSM 114161]